MRNTYDQKYITEPASLLVLRAQLTHNALAEVEPGRSIQAEDGFLFDLQQFQDLLGKTQCGNIFKTSLGLLFQFTVKSGRRE